MKMYRLCINFLKKAVSELNTMGGCAGVKSASMLACVLLVGVRLEEAATHGSGTLLLIKYIVY